MRRATALKVKTVKSEMKTCLATQQDIFGFYTIGIGQAAIYRTYRRALRFVVKPLAFRALVRHDVVIIHLNGGLHVGDIDRPAVLKRVGSLQRCAVLHRPLDAALVNGVVGAFRLACAAVDAIAGDIYGHGQASFDVQIAKVVPGGRSRRLTNFFLPFALTIR